MPKRSDIEKQIAALQASLEDADTDDEVWIKDETGHEVKVTGKRATTILGRYAKLWESEQEDSEEGGEEDDESDPEPAGGYFGRKKK